MTDVYLTDVSTTATDITTTTTMNIINNRNIDSFITTSILSVITIISINTGIISIEIIRTTITTDVVICISAATYTKILYDHTKNQ